jgi:hypothetical protein
MRELHFQCLRMHRGHMCVLHFRYASAVSSAVITATQKPKIRRSP